MNYNFDEIINRHGTDSVKWDAVENRWGRNDLIPMPWCRERIFCRRLFPDIREELSWLISGLRGADLAGRA